MNWIDFQCIAEECGLEAGFEIDNIETKDGTFIISYTDKDLKTGTVIVEDDS